MVLSVKQVLWLFVFHLLLAHAADNKAVSKPKPKGDINGLKVSKFGHGESSLGIYVGFYYNDIKTDTHRPRFRTNRQIQVNDTDLLAALAFKNKDKTKVTYDDLRFEVMNNTKMSDLLEFFVEDSFEIPMAADSNFRRNEYLHGVDRFPESSNKTVIYRPSVYHWKAKDALASAVLPSYVIIGFLSLIFYVGRSRFLPADYRKLFKFSNVSKILAKFAVFRLVFDVIYLTYLILFLHFKFFYTSAFLYFCFLVTDELINLVAFYFAIALFSQGYMTLDQSRKTLFKSTTIFLTFLYFLSVTCVEFYYKIKFNRSDFLINARTTTSMVVDSNSFIAPIIVFSKMIIFGAGAFSTYQTYKTSAKQDDRFLPSAIVIALAYYLSSFISLPIFRSFNDFLFQIKNKFLSVSQNSFLPRAEVPQLIQLVVVCWLAYYWRDLAYDKVSTSEDPEDGYELN